MFRKLVKEKYCLKDGRLYYKYQKNKDESIELKIPFKEEIAPILKTIHINNLHCGYKALCNRIIEEGFYWDGYSKEINNFIKNCHFCNGDKKNIKYILIQK